MASTCASYSELWTALGRVVGEATTRRTARLVYQDAAGDWLLLQPDGPAFSLFSSSVVRLMVVQDTKRA